MLDKNQFDVLKLITEDAIAEQRILLSFNSISEQLKITKDELEAILRVLENKRYLTQISMAGDDNFTVILHQEGIEAVQN